MALTFLVLQPGILGADDRIVFLFTKSFVQLWPNWYEFVATIKNVPAGAVPFLKHDFGWFCLQVAEYAPFSAASHLFRLLQNHSWTDQVYMSALSTLPAWLAIWAGWAILRRQSLTPSLATLTVIGIWIGSYGICYLDSTYLANAETLLICLQLLILGSGTTITTRQLLLAGVLGGMNTALKLYSLPCVIALALPVLMRGNRRQIMIWGAGLCSTLLPVIMAKMLLPLAGRNYFAEFEPALSNPDFALTIIRRLFRAIFSLNYGFLSTMPFILFAILCSRRRVFWIKLAGFGATLLITLPFAFWTGTSGIAGNRYMFPYLLIFLPEIGVGFAFVVLRMRLFVLVAPVMAVAFLPCLVYRHNITFEYATGRDAEAHTNGFTTLHPIIGQSLDGSPPLLGQSMPSWNPKFQPAIFGWTQVMHIISGKRMVLELPSPVQIDPADVPTYGLVFRVLFLKYHPLESITDTRIKEASSLYAETPAALKTVFFGLALAIALAWILLINCAILLVLFKPESAPPHKCLAAI